MSGWLCYGPDPGGQSPLRGAGFRRFLDICWPHADYFTLSSLAILYDDRCGLKKALRPWFADVITIDEWFGYGPGSSKMRVYRYHASPGSKEALLSCCHDIFFQYAPAAKHPDRPNRYRGTLSDLCIFSRGKLFFGSISHESECFLYPLDEDMAREAEAMDCWGPCLWRDERSRLDMKKYDWKDLGPLDDKFWNPKLAGAVLQCTFVEELAAFYEELLEWPAVERSAQRVRLRSEETGVELTVEYAEDYIPPMWPAAPGKQQAMLYIDFRSDLYQEAVGRAETLGAYLAEERAGQTILLDPAGHPFSISKI